MKTECNQHDYILWSKDQIGTDVFVMYKCKKCGDEKMYLKDFQKKKKGKK